MNITHKIPHAAAIMTTVALSLCSCGDKKPECEVITIHKADYCTWDKLVRIDSVISLGSPADSLVLSPPRKCVIGKESIIYWDDKAKQIYSFSLFGKYLHKIGRSGHAADEYSYLKDIDISPDGQNVYAFDADLVKEYNAADGRFLKKLDLPGVVLAESNGFAPSKDGGFLLFSDHGDYSVSHISTDGSVKNLRKREGDQIINSRFVRRADGTTLVLPDYGRFVIDSFNGTALSPEYSIDIPGQLLPKSYTPKDFHEFDRVDHLREFYKMVMSCYENDRYLYLVLVGPEQTYHYVFVNKKTKKVYATKGDPKYRVYVTGMDNSGIYALVFPEATTPDTYIYPVMKPYLDKGITNPVIVRISLREDAAS